VDQTSTASAARVILDAADIRRAVTRIAHEILERSRGGEDLAIVGVLTRGGPFAQRLADELARIEGRAIPYAAIDVRPFRDDTPRPRPEAEPPELGFPIEGRNVVLADEVIYTGRTVRAALDALCLLGRPRRIYLAALVDRGHRELPIRPDFVGKSLPTARDEYVCVQWRETDGVDAVSLHRGMNRGGRAPANGPSPEVGR
jgi:pyrimidine operon attenuation protein/uracil phosphoribosyltransferase